MILIGSLVVGVAWREHHALDAQFHHVIEKPADALRIGAIEKSGVGGNAEAAGESQFDGFDGFVVGAFAAHREVMLVAFAIHVHGK